MIRKIPFLSFPTHKRNHARSTKKTTKITRKWSVSSAQGSKNNLISKYKLITFLRLELLQDKVACQTWIVRVSKIKLMRWEGGLKETVWVLVKKCRSVISDLNLRFFIIESQSRFYIFYKYSRDEPYRDKISRGPGMVVWPGQKLAGCLRVVTDENNIHIHLILGHLKHATGIGRRKLWRLA